MSVGEVAGGGEKYEIAWASTFQASMHALEPVQQAAVLEAVTKLQQGNASVHLHALPPMKWVSFVVNRDAVRVICHRDGAALLLVYADLHKGAYRWAERHEPKKFGSVVRMVKVVIDDGAAEPRPAADDAVVPSPGPLADVKEKALRYFGVGPGVARALRALPDDDALLELCGRLEGPLAEALLSIAADPEGLDQHVARYHDAKKGEELTLAQAMKASVNSESIWIAPPEQQAVEAALKGDAASWRVFLHPSQKRLVTMKTSGPYLVTGGPGTGKTVVALHRARFLAETLCIAGADLRPVLMTTFSRVLARQLEDGMTMVTLDAPGVLKHVQTLTLTGAARAVLEKAGQKSAVLISEDIDAAWADALEHDALKKGRKFYEAERDQVVLAQGIDVEEQYLKASRTGRGERLERAAKKKIWTVLQAFEAALHKRGGDDPAGLARRATRLLDDAKVQSPFAAVVCDEAQDAGAYELRILAALATQPGERYPGADRLFLVGDGHQRLYARPVSPRACGIEVRGRSAKLKLNYRTTQGICAAALGVLEGLGLDVLESEADEGAEIDGVGNAGYRSLRAGQPPKSHAFESADAEADFIVQQIQGTSERPFLVLARTKTMLQALQERLKTRGVATTLLADTDVMPPQDHVVLATLLRSKGLEAPRVILAGMQESPLKFPGGSDDDRELWQKKEQMQIYVGMTRARDWCAVTAVKKAGNRSVALRGG